MDGGENWYDCSTGTYNTDTFTITAKTANNGRLYRCKVADAVGTVIFSNAAKLTLIPDPPVITAQPKSVSAAAGSTVSVSVSAAGSGLKYRWQYSVDGGENWYNCTTGTYNTDTFSPNVKASNNGRLYRCVITDASGASVTSEAAKLTVY